MKTGNSVRDADSRCAANADLSTDDEVSGDEEPTVRTRPSFQHIQDIQELIDKLAAVTKQLRRPGHS
jgi:hypothetical protein